MLFVDILGLTASFLTTTAFIPQVWRTLKTRDVSGISLATYVIITTGVILWLSYGFMKSDLPLILGNIVMLILTSTMLVLKIKFEKK